MREVVSAPWLSLVVGVSHLQVLLQVSVHCLFATGCAGPPPYRVWCRVAGSSSGLLALARSPGSRPARPFCLLTCSAAVESAFQVMWSVRDNIRRGSLHKHRCKLHLEIFSSEFFFANIIYFDAN